MIQQPAGLWPIFLSELWERFSYYGMRALLVLYLISATERGGFGWQEDSAYLLYGLYTWAVYLTPVLGGWLADRLLGAHRSLVIGGLIIIAGHLTLAGTELFARPDAAPVTLDSAPGALGCFLLGLLLIVVGTGFFKPCSAVMVGLLYAPGDSRRDAGYTLYYLGINIGALIAPLVAGTLGETVGWAWGFGAAAVGMVIGLTTYLVMRPTFLPGIGLPPARGSATGTAPPPRIDAADWQRIGVILILAVFGNIAFWAVFEQMGSSLNVFAAQSTDRTLWGWLDEPFPATWYQSVNPAAVIAFAPLLALLWPWLAARRSEPSTPMKFVLGLWLLGLAFLAMVLGALEAAGAGRAGPHWLVIAMVVMTWGELCLSPVGLSLVSKLAPMHLQSLLMGLWYLTYAFGNLAGGLLAAASVGLARGESTFVLPGLPGFFLLLTCVPIVVGSLLLLLLPLMKRWVGDRA